MSILQVWNSRCIQSFRFYPLSRLMCKHPSPTQLCLMNQILIHVPTRSFSWEGFYTSISLSTPVLTAQDLLLGFHSFSGLPFWAVIALSTLGIRTVFVFPFAVHQNQVIARITNLNAEIVAMAPELNKEVNIASKMYGWNENRARKIFRKNMKDYYRKFILRDNCHPFKIILLAIFQIPPWICLSIALRNLSMFAMEAPGLNHLLRTGGTLWFPDLTVPDMFFIPILLTIVNLLLIEITALRQIGKGSKFQKILLNVMRVFVLIVGGAATLNPTSVTFYWLCSSIFGAAQNIMFLSPRFRRIVRIPKTAHESSTPFKDIAENFRKRFHS